MAQTVAIERVDHIGIRVRNLDRALAFYGVLGFALVRRAEGDDVAIVRNQHGVELNLVFNANAGDLAANILMDVPDKFPGYTHIALRVASIPATIVALKANDIPITPGTGPLWRKRARLGVRARPRSQRHRAARPRTGRSRGRYPLRNVKPAPTVFDPQPVRRAGA
jgi:lactoylglutathione lyase